jgi:hypothetical protein
MESHSIFEVKDESAVWHRLRPVSARWPWITGGLLLQLAGVAAPAAYVISKAHHEDVTGQISKATLTLAWRQAVHSHAGLGLMIGGAALFVIGSMLLARPFVKSYLTLFVAIPLAALAGVLVLGAAALVIALLFAILSGGDFTDLGGSSSSGGTPDKRSRKRKRNAA